MSERDLWQEVLLRTIEDAILGPVQVDETAKPRIIAQARRYLTTPGKDLAMVCSFAGIDMGALIERMKKQIREAPAPKELLAAPRKTRAAFTKQIPREQKAIETYTFNGETLTIRQWAEKTGLSYSLVYNRISRGWPVSDAVTLTKAAARERNRIRRAFNAPNIHKAPPKRGLAPILYEYNGESLSLSEWSRRTGIKKVTLYKRIREGWPIAQALRPGDHRGADTKKAA